MRVAVPYYGMLIDPRQGLSQLFFIADVDLNTGAITNMQLESKPRNSGQSFSGWLTSQLVSGVLSTDNAGHWLTELEEAGLWHHKVAGLEPDELISNWLNAPCSDAVINEASTTTSALLAKRG